jgi:hypothetical protein
MGKASRTKGKRFEIEVCHGLSDLFPNIERNLAQYRTSSGRDFDNTQPISLQAKRGKTITMGTIKKGLEEAAGACDEEYEYPAVVTRADNGRSMITFYTDDWVEMQCRWEDGEL